MWRLAVSAMEDTLMNSIVESVANLIKKKPAELQLKDVSEAIPGVRRKANEFERDALSAEKKSMELREKAFQPTGKPVERPWSILRSARDVDYVLPPA